MATCNLTLQKSQLKLRLQRPAATQAVSREVVRGDSGAYVGSKGFKGNSKRGPKVLLKQPICSIENISLDIKSSCRNLVVMMKMKKKCA